MNRFPTLIAIILAIVITLSAGLVPAQRVQASPAPSSTAVPAQQGGTQWVLQYPNAWYIFQATGAVITGALTIVAAPGAVVTIGFVLGTGALIYLSFQLPPSGGCAWQANAWLCPVPPSPAPPVVQPAPYGGYSQPYRAQSGATPAPVPAPAPNTAASGSSGGRPPSNHCGEDIPELFVLWVLTAAQYQYLHSVGFAQLDASQLAKSADEAQRHADAITERLKSKGCFYYNGGSIYNDFKRFGFSGLHSNPGFRLDMGFEEALSLARSLVSAIW